MALLVGGFGIQFEVTNPLMATTVFHLSPVGFGLLGTVMAAGGIAGSVYSARRADPDSREFLAWAVLFGAAEVAAAAMPVAWAYGVMLVIVGAAIQLFAVSATVYVQQATGDAQRGHALSAYNAGFMGFGPPVPSSWPGWQRPSARAGADRARRCDRGLRSCGAGCHLRDPGAQTWPSASLTIPRCLLAATGPAGLVACAARRTPRRAAGGRATDQT